MKVSFELTMPNVGSWNGKWTGADRKYYIIKSFRAKFFKETIAPLFDGNQWNSWYYNFGDGWGANVRAEIIDAAEARKRQKLSKGFAGYDWMVDSIISHGSILNTAQRKEALQTA